MILALMLLWNITLAILQVSVLEGEEGEVDDMDIGGDIEEVAVDDGGGEEGEDGEEDHGSGGGDVVPVPLRGAPEYRSHFGSSLYLN